MAGGKLTPRQKMINLMYLVLTALLALNVSKDILQSIQALANSLRVSAMKFDEKNDATAADVISGVKKEMEQGNKKNEYLIPLIQEITSKTDETVGEIEKHVQNLIQIVGVDEETGTLKKPDEVENNFRYMMKGDKDEFANNGRGAGAAYKVHLTLEEYVKWARQTYKKMFPNVSDKELNTLFKDIIVDPKDDPTVTNKEDKIKTWEMFNFGHNTPVISHIAILEKLKTDVRVIESDLLESARRLLQSVTFKIDSLVAMDAPESQVVAAGLPFKTTLFVAMSSSEIKPKFESSSGRIKVLPGGNSAELTVIASGQVVPKDKDEGWQNYTATIRVPKADGTEAVLRINKKFKVRRPVIKVNSAAIQRMYRDCANDVYIDVPALGEYYDPEITADGAEVAISKKDRRLVRVIPNGNKTVIHVKSKTGGQVIPIGSLEYFVNSPPKPTIEVRVNGKPWDGSSPWKGGDQVQLRVVPDKEFAQSLPHDARYRIQNVEVLVKEGLGAAQPIKQLGSSQVATTPEINVSLITISRGRSPGTKIYLQIDRIDRINFQNKAIEVPFSSRELTISGIIE
jgi:gliding motility-associated protein GldM